MKKILMAAVALTAISATPAFAADTVATYSVTGSVGGVCSANAAGTIGLGSLVDGTGTLNSPGGGTPDTGAYCNSAGTTIKVEHANLTTAGTAPSGFTTTVAFTPKVTAGGGTPLIGDQASGTLLGAFSGLLVEATSLTVPANTKPMAGSYAGSITVTLTPGA